MVIAVKKFFLDQYLEVSYRQSRLEYGRRTSGKWSPEDAQKWIGYLATRLTAERQRYIAWWMFPYYEFRHKLAYSVGLVTNVLILLLTVAHFASVSRAKVDDQDYQYNSGLWFVLVLAFTLLTVNVVSIGITPRSLRTRRRMSKSAHQRRGVVGEAMVVSLPLLALPIFAAGVVIPQPEFVELDRGFPSLFLTLAAVAAVFPATLAASAHNIDPSCRPDMQVRQDRNAAFIFGSACASGSGGLFVALMLATDQTVSPTALVWLATCALGACTMAVMNSASWFWALTAAYMAIRGRASFFPVRFWQDACERGILRREGPYYRFRHAFMQERLAEVYLADSRSSITRLTRLRAAVGLVYFRDNEFDPDELVSHTRRFLEESVPAFGISGFRFDVWLLVIEALVGAGKVEKAFDELRSLENSKVYRRSRWDLDRRDSFRLHRFWLLVETRRYGAAIAELRRMIGSRRRWHGRLDSKVINMQKEVDRLKKELWNDGRVRF